MLSIHNTNLCLNNSSYPTRPHSIIVYYHSLYGILDFDWLIHLQITACKYRSVANNRCKYFIEHAHFENASSASIKKSFFHNVNMARFAVLSESELSTILEENDAENTKKATKVTLNIFRGYMQEKGLREAELLTSKVKLANACMSN